MYNFLHESLYDYTDIGQTTCKILSRTKTKLVQNLNMSSQKLQNPSLNKKEINIKNNKGQTIKKNMKGRVIILVNLTHPETDLLMYEVLS